VAELKHTNAIKSNGDSDDDEFVRLPPRKGSAYEFNTSLMLCTDHDVILIAKGVKPSVKKGKHESIIFCTSCWT
jgi:hypothetical protein